MEDLHLHKFVLDNVPRILSWIDRRQGSPTYGCSDRNYWHYKIVDFPCAMLQETALTLALLSTVNFKGNTYFRNVYIQELAKAQVKFWKKIQRNNGAFDEFFPNERSFSATAFTLYSTCMTVKLLNLENNEFQESTHKACTFLINYGDPGASNQVAAAIAAITIYAELFSDYSFDNSVEEMLNRLLESQSPEGWTPEYGGFDVGYQSITVSYLSDYISRKPNNRLSDKLLKMIEFLALFIHPDGTAGGEYGSRNTSFLVPYGFVFNSNKSNTSSAVVNNLFISADSQINTFIDDRYICHFIIPSYLLAIKFISKNKIKFNELPHEKLFSTVFKESGLWIESRPDFYFICNTKKQGVFKIYGKKGQGVLSNSGYNIEIDSRRLAVTNWINNNASIINNKSGAQIKGSFFLVSNKLPNSFYHFTLRLLSYFFKKRLLPILKMYFILREKPIKGFFERSIKVSDKLIVVDDKIHYKSKKKVCLYNNEISSFRYVAPSNYFQINELSGYNPPNKIKHGVCKNIFISQIINTRAFEVEKSCRDDKGKKIEIS